jgi:ribosomal protein S12 methylthiotransferase accessory factor YcaO
MLSFAALKYRNVLTDFGGPVAKIEMGEFPVRGRKLVLANATLKSGLTRKGPMALFGACDGTGVHQTPSVARHIAVSEALERWAFSALIRSEQREEFGFDIDPTTSGMSAFPGLLDSQARRFAVLEGIERYSLMAWWEGRAEGRVFDTDWPGVSAVAIDGPFGGITVVVYARTQWGGYVYGHAAAESFTGASEKAIIELARSESVLRSWWLARIAGERKDATNIFERRCLHFATEAGHAEFLNRVHSKATGPAVNPEVICDSELPGPWSEYATVWRFALRPPSDGHIRGGDGYFFL